MTELPRRALSVRQPWAWAIFHGKDVENRSWGFFGKQRHSAFVREIAIHASKGMTQDEYRSGTDTINHILGAGACPPPADLVRGGIIGSVRVVDVISKCGSGWFFGPFGLLLTEQMEIDQPIACSGALGYFNWTAGGELEQPLRWMRQWISTQPDPMMPSTPFSNLWESADD